MRASQTGLEQYNYIMGFLNSEEDLTGQIQGIDLKFMNFEKVS